MWLTTKAAHGQVSLDRYLTHKAGTRAVAFVPSAWHRVKTGILQVPLCAPSSADWKPQISLNRKIIGKTLSHFSKFKNAVLIICNFMTGSRNWDSIHLLDTICLDTHKLFLNGGEL